MALWRHRLPGFWLALTLGSVFATLVGTFWWERQLPARLAEAAASGRLDDCIRYGEQLAALSWLPDRSPADWAHCRRAKAALLWQQGRRVEALQLQGLLSQSSAATAGDRKRLEEWRHTVRSGALIRFKNGDLEGSIAALVPLAEPGDRNGSLAADLRAIWSRNRLGMERAEALAQGGRWWEALDALNRLDHPWWQSRSATLRKEVESGLQSLEAKNHQHDGHGDLPHTVAGDRLDSLVQRRIASGMGEWQAFKESCAELGGRIVEAGPESACQR